MVIKQHCDKCGCNVIGGELALGASIIRVKTVIGNIDLCDVCKNNLESIVFKWLDKNKGE